MHLFRTQPLIAKLAKGQVSNTQKAYYLLASFLMFTVAYYTGFASGNATWTLPSTLEGATVGVITIIGVVKAFDAAGGEKASDFIAQFTCLYVPITISTMLVVWTIFWGVLFGFRESLMAISESRMQFAVNLSRLHADMFNFVTFVAVVVIQGVTFYRMTMCLGELKALSEDGHQFARGEALER
jgi:hypothetical protein